MENIISLLILPIVFLSYKIIISYFNEDKKEFAYFLLLFFYLLILLILSVNNYKEYIVLLSLLISIPLIWLVRRIYITIKNKKEYERLRVLNIQREKREIELYREKMARIRDKIAQNEPLNFDDFYLYYVDKKYSIEGVYVLMNISKNKNYVGKSLDTVSRVKDHIEGRGNAHLFADLKYGDIFKIRLIPFDSRNFFDIHEQERETIKMFHGFTRGYNRTK